MTKKIVHVSMDATLSTIIEIFQNVRFHHLLVVDELERLTGVISDRDVLKATSPYLNSPSERPLDRDSLNKRAHQIMSRRPITARKNITINTAIQLLLTNSISCLPITAENGTIEGIVTWKDLIKIFVKQQNLKKK